MKQNLFIISILESAYIIYMLNYFKTKYSLSFPIKINNKYFIHPIGKHEYPKSNICKFGHDMSWLMAIYFIIKGYLFSLGKKRRQLVIINKLVLLTIFIFSLMNLNAVVYLLPVFIIEMVFFMK